MCNLLLSRSDWREAFVRIKMQDIRSMIKDPEKPKKALARRIVCAPVVNIDGEKRAFVKEMEKETKRYEKRKEALRDLELPEIQ
ncbi:MAG: hypothetical protein O7H41_15255 [Planctomycetota bacterium]|nr:hypothetical protein [Planctomycetota bacterium]